MASILRDLDIVKVWAKAEHDERRVLVEELIEKVTVFPDHLEVKVTGAPPLNVLYGEVGLKLPEIVGVGDPKQQIDYQILAARSIGTSGSRCNRFNQALATHVTRVPGCLLCVDPACNIEFATCRRKSVREQ